MVEAFTQAWKFHSLGRSVIPSGGGEKGKASLVKWEPYQTAKPTDDEVSDWQEKLQPKVWAMVTGPISGIFVIDCDTPESAGAFALAGLTPHVKTPRGSHYYFRYPQFPVKNATGLAQNIDVRGEGGYVNFCGGQYEALKMPTDENLYLMTQMPRHLLNAMQNGKGKPAKAIPATIAAGERDATLTSLAGAMRKRGMTISAMEAALLTTNTEQCDPPLAEADVVKIARSVGRYEPDAPKPEPEPKVMPALKCEQKAGGYEFKWDNISLVMSRLKEHRDNRVNGELKVTVSNSQPEILLQSSLNLLSPRTRKETAKTLIGKSPSYDWDTILEDVCTQTLEAMREGEPVVTLWAGADVKAPVHLVYPLVAEKQANFIYGPGGSGKSLLGLYLAACLMHPDWKNPLGFKVTGEARKVLYLDWEAYDGEVNWRVNMLAKGLHLDTFYVEYCRMHAPIAADVDVVSRKLIETGCDVIIVDSVAAAAGGNLNATDSALPMFAAVRYLNVTPIFIAHTGKDKEKGIYGNIFFENYGRNNWEVKPDKGDPMEIIAGMFHMKANMSHKLDPFGIKFTFTKSVPHLSTGDIVSASLMPMSEFKETDVMAAELPLYEKVIKILSKGPMPVISIAAELGITDPKKVDSIRTRLYKYDQIFERDGAQWRLKAFPRDY
ncbi:MAG: AAA family ATPase [Dehalococcoidales bacterium]|nr:AAA family ATPase [Dehalococcoidales bacterium]